MVRFHAYELVWIGIAIVLLVLGALSVSGQTQDLKQDTYTHKVIKPPASAGAAFDIDFSNVTTNIGGGGGGGIGGANTQFQYNNSFAFGGVPYTTYNGTVVTQTAGARYMLIDPTDITKKTSVNLALIPTATTRTFSIAGGGDSVSVVPATGAANQWANGLSSSGALTFSQPSFANLSGTLAFSQTSMSPNKLLGRNPVSGTGAIEEITLGTNLSLSGTTLNATSGTGTPGGSTTELQYNSSGVFGGISTATFDGTAITLQTGAGLSPKLYLVDPTDVTKRLKIDLSGFTTGTLRKLTLANLDSVTVAPDAGASNNFLTGISTGGIITKAQPSFTNLSGTISFAQNNIPIGHQIWQDAVNGNDGTGTSGNLARPFLTLSAALAAAVSGDVVYAGVGTTDIGTTPLLIPAGVTLVGAGADSTLITSAVAAASNRAGVEIGTGGAIYGVSITNTSSTGTAFGVNTSSTAFTSAYMGGCKITAVQDGIKINKTSTTGLTVENTNILSQGAAINIAVAGTHNFRNCALTADGTSSSAAYGILAPGGTTIFRDGSIVAGNSTGTNVGVNATGASTTVELHNVAVTLTATGVTNWDLSQASSAVIKKDNVSRTDGTALSNTGTITDLISVYTGNINNVAVTTAKVADGAVTYAKIQNVSAGSRLLGRGAGGGAGVPQEITLGTGLSMTGTVLDTTGGGGGGTAGGSDTQVQFNDGGLLAGDSGLTYSKTGDELTITNLPAANTFAAGLLLTDTTTASSGSQQYSPGLMFTGQGWKTNATAASQPVDFRIYTTPVQGAANPSGNLTIDGRINNGTWGGSSGGTWTFNSLGQFIATNSATPTTLPTYSFANETTKGISGFTNNQIEFDINSAQNNVFAINKTWSLPTAMDFGGTLAAPTYRLSLTGNGLEVYQGATSGNWGTFKSGTYDTLNNGVGVALTLNHHLSSGTAAANIGTGIQFNIDSDTTANRTAGSISSKWSDAVDATRSAYYDFLLVSSGAAQASKMRLFSDGGLSVNNTTDPGAGVISANTGFRIGTGPSTSGKILKSDGTTFTASTETYAVPGTSGNVLTSDGTNWTSQPPGGGAGISDVAFASSWDGVITIGPSKNAVYDWGHTFDTDDDGKVNVLDMGAGVVKTNSSGVVAVATAEVDYWDTADFIASGASHAHGLVPDPGSSAGTAKFLREDATWVDPLAGGGSLISDTAFASSWNGVTTVAPSKNAVYDWGHTFDTDDDGKVNVLDTGAGAVLADSSGVVSSVSPGTNGNVLTSNGTTWVSSPPSGGGGGGTPGGSDTQIQFNDGGAFGGDGNFTWSKSSKFMSVLNAAAASVFMANDATNSSTTTLLNFRHNTTGTASNGLGVRLAAQAETSTTDNQTMGNVDWAWTDVTDATRTAKLQFQLANSASQNNVLALFGSGGISVNNTTDPGAGYVNANTGFKVGGTDIKDTTQTLTNKRVTKRVGTVSSSATPTINTDNVDIFTITALATNITSMTTNLSGTPNEGDSLLIWIKDNGTARTIAWGASYIALDGFTLPATTTANKYLYITFYYNATAAKWVMTGTGQHS